MARLSVAEAAERLAVGPQRIHQRIRDGSLPAERVGGRWIIDDKDLRRVADSHKPGRPLSARSAWALVAVASGDPSWLGDLAAPDRSRARSRLRALLGAAEDVDNEREVARMLSRALRNRAARRSFHASVPDLPDLRGDHRILRSGLSDPGSGLSAGDVVEGYLLKDDLDGVMHDYLLSEVDRDRANVVLHVFAPGARPRHLDERARKLLLAADLAEHGGPRELVRAVESLRDLAAGPGSAADR
ncbi:excisionase family DNA binding protein [Nocardioides albertanoniae]|uniref:Excisionase family DNA binding protein n=1 Tax=Nocardioides albertanoniae TaxID=1175486 RepID=A0A543A1W8_9ACTN|nr:helix-turn-helix domain-containing protein [Nocardioides albertanoniae]TQL66564.1 excisionase family DNA binding protein [Nocardioides albertanoniae]